LLLLRELQIRQSGTDQHRGAADQLADGLPKIVFDVGSRLRIPDREPQAIHLSLARVPARFPNPASRGSDA
jgi:hypothetical protein